MPPEQKVNRFEKEGRAFGYYFYLKSNFIAVVNVQIEILQNIATANTEQESILHYVDSAYRMTSQYRIHPSIRLQHWNQAHGADSNGRKI